METFSYCTTQPTSSSMPEPPSAPSEDQRALRRRDGRLQRGLQRGPVIVAVGPAPSASASREPPPPARWPPRRRCSWPAGRAPSVVLAPRQPPAPPRRGRRSSWRRSSAVTPVPPSASASDAAPSSPIALALRSSSASAPLAASAGQRGGAAGAIELQLRSSCVSAVFSSGSPTLEQPPSPGFFIENLSLVSVLASRIAASPARCR